MGDRRFNRVFGIGLSRTGTTSLDAALWHLGLTSRHNPDPARMLAGDFSPIDDADAATDIAAAAVFRELDAAFPGSVFVLTVRDAESWLASVTRHIGSLPDVLDGGPSGDLRRAVYGDARPSAEQLLAAYRSHLLRVMEQFEGRPADLLIMDITAGQGWDTLCPFLGIGRPEVAFPNANGAADKGGRGSPYPARAQQVVTSENFGRIFGKYAG